MYYPEPNQVYLDRPYPNSINCLRMTMGLSQEAFARHCGISCSTLKRYDRGDQAVKDIDKEKIERACFEEVILYYKTKAKEERTYTIKQLIYKFNKIYNNKKQKLTTIRRDKSIDTKTMFKKMMEELEEKWE